MIDSRINVFDLPPKGSGEWPELKGDYIPLPGRVHLVSMKVPKTGSGIIMTDREKHSCDIARVVVSGVPELRSGQIVLLMALVGCYPYDDLAERIVGTGRWREGMPDPWNYAIPAKLRGFHWVLSPGWVWASKVKDSGLILMPERQDRYRVQCQSVLGYDGPPQEMTADEIAAMGWELFVMKRPGGFERYLVNVG